MNERRTRSPTAFPTSENGAGVSATGSGLRRSVETLRSVLRFQRFERDPVARRLARAVSVADLRAMARRRLPGGVFDRIDGGAEDERTLAANTEAFDDGTTAVSLADYINTQFDPTLSWRDIEWLRSIWSGPLVLKGIQTVADARLAAQAGVDAVALSNHGGRQLDGAPATLSLVAPVADAVGDAVEIICDGGVRRGSDIVKAVALGARACMAARAYLYGLAVGGQRGVTHVLQMLDADMRRTMALVGARSVSELDRGLVAGPAVEDGRTPGA